MIPVLIGAAVGLAGAALLSGDDKSQQPDTRKRQVSEDYVSQYLRQAGKGLPCKTRKGDDFSDEFARVDSLLARSAHVDQIRNELHSIERTAKNLRDVTALSKVAEYYDRIGAYQKAWYCREAIKKF